VTYANFSSFDDLWFERQVFGSKKCIANRPRTYSIVILISDYVFKIHLSYEYINERSCYTETYESISVHNYEQVVGVAWKGWKRPHSAVKDKTHVSNGISNQTCAEEVLYLHMLYLFIPA
jgi:hypothetical protein